MTRTFKLTLIASIAVVVATIVALYLTRPMHSYTQANPFGEGWVQEKLAFVQGYESKHGEIDNATEMWLFSNAHRMCWWLTTKPRLPSEALTYGITELQMSSDQTITVTELGMQLIADCPDYNPRKGVA